MLSEAQQAFDPGSIVHLYELDCRQFGVDILRFSNDIDSDQPLRFGGYEYALVQMEAEGFEASGRGALPTPTLRSLPHKQLRKMVDSPWAGSASTAYYNGYTESGTTNSNISFNSRSVDILDGRLELALARSFSDAQGEIELRAWIWCGPYQDLV